MGQIICFYYYHFCDNLYHWYNLSINVLWNCFILPHIFLTVSFNHRHIFSYQILILSESMLITLIFLTHRQCQSCSKTNVWNIHRKNWLKELHLKFQVFFIHNGLLFHKWMCEQNFKKLATSNIRVVPRIPDSLDYLGGYI